MVDGFRTRKSDGTVFPTRSALGSGLTVREALPKAPPKKVEQLQSERRKEFAKGKIKLAGKGAKVAGRGLKETGKLLQFGAEKLKQRGIEKSIREREFTERLDRGIDAIIDDPNTSDASKLRLMRRFARLNRRNFTKQQRDEISAINRELINRIKESKERFVSSPQGVGIGSGISEEELAKLPSPVRSDIEKAVA